MSTGTKSFASGTPAVYVGHKGTGYELGTIIGYRNGHLGPEAVFKEAPRRGLKKIKQFFTGDVHFYPTSGLYPLLDVSPSTNWDRNISTKHRMKAFFTTTSEQSERRCLFSTVLDGLGSKDVVVWTPEASQRVPENSFLGEIMDTYEHFDVLARETFYASIKFLDNLVLLRDILGDKMEHHTEGDALFCVATVPILELKRIGEMINCGRDSSTADEPPEVLMSQDERHNKTSEESCCDRSLPDRDDVHNASASTTTSRTWKGIQGSLNSCYLDSCLFILFATLEGFDELLLSFRESGSVIERKVRQALIDVVHVLRTEFYVSSEKMTEFRHALSAVKDDYGGPAFMDPEEFLLDLFQVLRVPDFFHFDNEASDKVHQIITTAENATSLIAMKEVSLLFKDSMCYNQVSLIARPSPALILKLPYCDGRPFYGSKMVVPDPSFQLMLSTGDEIELRLFGIICLKSSHYVSFVRLDNDSRDWMYFDSSPSDGKPKVDALHDLDKDLWKVQREPGVLSRESFSALQHRRHLEFICRFCYMCFYK